MIVALIAALAVMPHLGELRTDGFVVALETTEDARVSVELARGKEAPVRYTEMVSSRGREHRLRIVGLSPRERVRYRVVVDGHVVSEASAQAAPPEDATALDFLVYGDTRDGEGAERATAIDALAAAPVLALHTGDLVPTGDDEGAWRRLFEIEQPLLEQVPLYVALGNHELYRDADGKMARRYLPLPPYGDDGAYYSFRIGPARFIALDSNRVSEAQTEWLHKTLASAANEPGHPHVFVFMHHPPFSTGGHCGSAVEQAAWVQLFEQYRPSAVFAGHDHAYERLERSGVRYFVTGGGGAPVYPERQACPEHDRRAQRLYRAEHHLLRVRLRGAAIEIEVARPQAAPIEVVRWSRGDSPPPGGPLIVDERRSTGLLRPLTGTLAVLVFAVALYALRARREGRS